MASPILGPSLPEASRKGKKAQRPRDERDFQDPQTIRGIIQAMEEERTAMRSDLAQLTQLVMAMAQPPAQSNPPNQPLPSIEDPKQRTPPNGPRPSLAMPTRMADNYLTPEQHRNPSERDPTPNEQSAKLKIIEKVIPLDDGSKPTYKQWRITVRDRLRTNRDYYDTEDLRKTFIWASTIGKARDYLEPHYQGEDDEFNTAEEMIEHLEAYFLTGYEIQDYSHRFNDMKMGESGHANETFAEFSVRFRHTAVRGWKNKAMWYEAMWEKLTPQLRKAATQLVQFWKEDYEEMVVSLTSIDRVRRRNWELDGRVPTRVNQSERAGTSRSPVPSRSTPKPPRFDSYSKPKPMLALPAPPPPTPSTTPNRTRFSAGPSRSSSAKPSSNACFFCNKVGHFKSQCPDLPAIRQMILEIDNAANESGGETSTVLGENDDDDDVEENVTLPTREGNGEA
jgi:hypothetical protein